MRSRSSESSAEDVEVDSPSPPTDASLISFPNGAGGTPITKSDEAANSQDISTHDATQPPTQELDRRRSTDKRPATARSRRPSNTNWKPARAHNGSVEGEKVLQSTIISVPPAEDTNIAKMPNSYLHARRSRSRNPWSMSLLTLAITVLAIISIF